MGTLKLFCKFFITFLLVSIFTVETHAANYATPIIFPNSTITDIEILDISADENLILFSTKSTEVEGVEQASAYGINNIYLYDNTNKSTLRITNGLDGKPSSWHSYNAKFTANYTKVVLHSRARNLIPNQKSNTSLFLYEIANKTFISVDTNKSNFSANASLSYFYLNSNGSGYKVSSSDGSIEAISIDSGSNCYSSNIEIKELASNGSFLFTDCEGTYYVDQDYKVTKLNTLKGSTNRLSNNGEKAVSFNSDNIKVFDVTNDFSSHIISIDNPLFKRYSTTSNNNRINLGSVSLNQSGSILAFSAYQPKSYQLDNTSSTFIAIINLETEQLAYASIYEESNFEIAHSIPSFFGNETSLFFQPTEGQTNSVKSQLGRVAITSDMFAIPIESISIKSISSKEPLSVEISTSLDSSKIDKLYIKRVHSKDGLAEHFITDKNKITDYRTGLTPGNVEYEITPCSINLVCNFSLKIKESIDVLDFSTSPNISLETSEPEYDWSPSSAIKLSSQFDESADSIKITSLSNKSYSYIKKDTSEHSVTKYFSSGRDELFVSQYCIVNLDSSHSCSKQFSKFNLDTPTSLDVDFRVKLTPDHEKIMIQWNTNKSYEYKLFKKLEQEDTYKLLYQGAKSSFEDDTFEFGDYLTYKLIQCLNDICSSGGIKNFLVDRKGPLLLSHTTAGDSKLEAKFKPVTDYYYDVFKIYKDTETKERKLVSTLSNKDRYFSDRDIVLFEKTYYEVIACYKDICENAQTTLEPTPNIAKLPLTPASLNVSVDKYNSALEISWSKIDSADGYKLSLQNDSGDSASQSWLIEDNQTTSFIYRYDRNSGKKLKFLIQSFVHSNHSQSGYNLSPAIESMPITSINAVAANTILPSQVETSYQYSSNNITASWKNYMEHDYYLLAYKSSTDDDFTKVVRIGMVDKWGRRNSNTENSFLIPAWKEDATGYEVRVKGCSNHRNRCSEWSNISNIDMTLYDDVPFVTDAPTLELLDTGEVKVTVNIPVSKRIVNTKVKYTPYYTTYLDGLEREFVVSINHIAGKTITFSSSYCVDNSSNCSPESKETVLEVPEDFIQKPQNAMSFSSMYWGSKLIDGKPAAYIYTGYKNNENYHVETYRSVNSSALQLHTKVEFDESSDYFKFDDFDVKQNDIVRYQFKLCNLKGCGPLSTPTTVTVRAYPSDFAPPTPTISNIVRISQSSASLNVLLSRKETAVKFYLGHSANFRNHNYSSSTYSESSKIAEFSNLKPATQYYAAAQACYGRDNCSALSKPFVFTTQPQYQGTAFLQGNQFRNPNTPWSVRGTKKAHANELDTFSGTLEMSEFTNISQGVTTKTNVIFSIKDVNRCDELYNQKAIFSRGNTTHTSSFYKIIYTGDGCGNDLDQYSLYVDSIALSKPVKISDKDSWLNQWIDLNLSISGNGKLSLSRNNQPVFTSDKTIDLELFQYIMLGWNTITDNYRGNISRISKIEVAANSTEMPNIERIGDISIERIHPTATGINLSRRSLNYGPREEITLKYAYFDISKNTYSEIKTTKLNSLSYGLNAYIFNLRSGSNYYLLTALCTHKGCSPFSSYHTVTLPYNKLNSIPDPKVSMGPQGGQLEISLSTFNMRLLDSLTFYYKSTDETEYKETQPYNFPEVYASGLAYPSNFKFVLADLFPGQNYQFKIKICNILGCYEKEFDASYTAPHDRDNDGVADNIDAFPDNPDEALDSDRDGIGNNEDKDDDNDGLPDIFEESHGLNPLSIYDATYDLDNDGYSNIYEYSLGFLINNATSNPATTGLIETFDDYNYEVNINGTNHEHSYYPSFLNGYSYKREFGNKDNEELVIKYSGKIGTGKLGFAVFSKSSFSYSITINDEQVSAAPHDFFFDNRSSWNIVAVPTTAGDADIVITITAKNSQVNFDALYIPAVTPVTMNDFNSDGKSDILYRSEDDLSWRLDLIDNFNVHSSITDLAMSNCCGWLFNGIGDFNADGFNDVIVRNVSSGKWYIYNLDGSQVISKGYVPLESAINVGVQAIADFNNDGYSDVLLRNEQTGEWKIALLNNRSVIEEITPPMSTVLGWKIVDTKDFDGNGSADILIRNESSGAWYMYLYDNTNIISRGYVSTLPDDLNVDIYGVGDFDTDGKHDLLSRNKETNEWVIWHMNGKELKHSLIAPFSTAESWEFNSIGDYNGDGFSDVAIRNKSSDKVHIYLWNGESVITKDYLNLILDDDYQAKSLVH